MPFAVIADDRYTDTIYTAAVFSYWCEYKKLPKSNEQLTEIEKGYLVDTEANTNLELDYETWLEAVSYNIDGNELTLIKQSRVVTGSKFQSTVTSQSKSNCGSLQNKK